MIGAYTRSRLNNDRGIALMLVLLFVVLLAAIVTDFMYRMHVEASLVIAHTSDHDAYLAAKSGVATSMSILHADRIANIEESTEFGGVYDGLEEAWAQPASVSSYNEDMVNITITDEYGKINLNALVFESADGVEVVNATLEQIVRDIFTLFIGMEEDPTDLILDWLDSDDDVRELGGESDYYEGLTPPFSSKNGPFDSIEELLLLPGITPEVYFGLPSEEEQLEAETNPPEEGGRQLIALTELFTVHGHPEGKINLNTCPVPGEVMTAVSIVQNLPYMGIEETLRRLEENQSFVSEQEMRESPYILAAPIPQPGDQVDPNAELIVTPPMMFTAESNVFRIQGDATAGGAQVRIEVLYSATPAITRIPNRNSFASWTGE